MKRASGFCGLVAGLLTGAGAAVADMRITEWMYSSAFVGEFVEFTNVGQAPVDLTGWSFDDDSATPGVFDLSGFGVVAPGESVVITEASAADFIADWSLSGVQVLGGVTNNLGRNDQVNLFDAGNQLVDRLTYGDEALPGTIRTQFVSGNPASPAALGADDAAQWVLSTVGDSYGSYVSLAGDVGNPGLFVPEPGTLLLLGLGAALLGRRR